MRKSEIMLDGELVWMPLGNAKGVYVPLNRIDYYHLKNRGIDITALSWRLNDNGKGKKYVRVKIPGVGLTQVARLIMGEPPHARVGYRDGNPLNLRRENLMLIESDPRGKLEPRLPKAA